MRIISLFGLNKRLVLAQNLKKVSTYDDKYMKKAVEYNSQDEHAGLNNMVILLSQHKTSEF